MINLGFLVSILCYEYKILKTIAATIFMKITIWIHSYIMWYIHITLKAFYNFFDIKKKAAVLSNLPGYTIEL